MKTKKNYRTDGNVASLDQSMVNISSDDPSTRYEKLYTMLLDTIPSSVLLIDRNMRIVMANCNFLEKSKRSISNTIGHHLKEVFPPIILDCMDLTDRINEVFEKNRPTMGERMTYRVPGIPLRIYYYRILPFSWKRIVENALLLMDDVTEQVRLGEEVLRVQRHLASVVESAHDLVISTDTKGYILTWNSAAEKLSGYILNEVKGHLFYEQCAKDYREEVKRVFLNIAFSKTGKDSKTGEWDLLNKHGFTIPVSWVCSAMEDEQSQTVGIVAVGRDLTERRKFEIQLLQTQKLAALGVMAGGIAHEIRNPLAICSSAAQFLMKEDIAPEFMKECVEKIHKGIQRASLIIESLLKFARSSKTTELVQIDLNALLKETLALVDNQAKIQKIQLKFNLPSDPVSITGNTSLLQQMFMNLFLNAINAMPNGGDLSVLVKKKTSETLISISDTGCGISKENINNIFDPFYTTLPVGKGTGLGLSICYSIANQHFGSIKVDSIEGKGSTFTVSLPVL